jgi:hypothetical protein
MVRVRVTARVRFGVKVRVGVRDDTAGDVEP